MKILLVDDQKLFINSLKVYLEKVLPDADPILVAFSGEEAIEILKRERPDLALIDIFMPDMNGIEVVHFIHDRFPGIKMLMLTNFDDHDFVYDAMNYGASGFLLKEEIDEQQLILAIRNALSGVMSISPHALKRLLDSEKHEDAKSAEAKDSGSDLPQWFYILSPKEKRILKLLVEGFKNDEIAEKVFLSQQTVKNYVHTIYSKMGIKNRSQAVRMGWKYVSKGIL